LTQGIDMEKIEWEDIQGLVRSGYGRLEYAAYVLWRFRTGEPAAAKLWLRDLSQRLTHGRSGDALLEREETEAAEHASKGERDSRPDTAINLALSESGLKLLGLSDAERSRFSLEFVEGMAPKPTEGGACPRRCNLLGDLGESSPQHWDWGGWGGNRVIDGMLLLYARTRERVDALVEAESRLMQDAAEPIMATSGQSASSLGFRGHFNRGKKEHFGFRDGISQPVIDGTPKAKRLKKRHRKEARLALVQPGEFLLGYLNERQRRVCMSPPKRARGAKPEKLRELLRNGTYLVVRQLEQDVEAFHDFVSHAAEQLKGEANPSTKDWVTARLLGRWPNGEPLVPPGADGRADASKRNDFLYQLEDKMGLACPVGAHIRRANPRDIIGPDPDTALRLSKMHRIIRRGRPYRDVDGNEAQGKERRGMLFICLNADIAGQFEHIQHVWLNNPHFAGLYTGCDALSHSPIGRGAMTIQHRPVNLQIENGKPFVRVRGGAYFFLPGIAALRLLVQ
jgi:Dyp-type peroxidase family